MVPICRVKVWLECSGRSCRSGLGVVFFSIGSSSPWSDCVGRIFVGQARKLVSDTLPVRRFSWTALQVVVERKSRVPVSADTRGANSSTSRQRAHFLHKGDKDQNWEKRRDCTGAAVDNAAAAHHVFHGYHGDSPGNNCTQLFRALGRAGYIRSFGPTFSCCSLAPCEPIDMVLGRPERRQLGRHSASSFAVAQQGPADNRRSTPSAHRARARSLARGRPAT